MSSWGRRDFRFGTPLATRVRAGARIKVASINKDGRTYKEVEALPDGATYYVPNYGVMRYIASCLHLQGRKADSIVIRLKNDVQGA